MRLLFAVIAAAALAGCQSPGLLADAKSRKAHAAFRAQPKWRDDTYFNPEILARATAKNARVEISINEQRGLLLADGQIAMDFPVATGRPTYPTPPGQFSVREKKPEHASNLYGKLYDAEGKLVDADADTRTMVMPEGGRFEGSAMPLWMRVSDDGMGMHVGIVPGGRPASHGCIRLRQKAASTLYELLPVGAAVTVSYGMPALGTGEAGPTPQVAPHPIAR
jgi:lipoprotein-anchoring transpeptidase ErfK/SrfK